MAERAVWMANQLLAPHSDPETDREKLMVLHHETVQRAVLGLIGAGQHPTIELDDLLSVGRARMVHLVDLWLARGADDSFPLGARIYMEARRDCIRFCQDGHEDRENLADVADALNRGVELEDLGAVEHCRPVTREAQLLYDAVPPRSRATKTFNYELWLRRLDHMRECWVARTREGPACPVCRLWREPCDECAARSTITAPAAFPEKQFGSRQERVHYLVDELGFSIREAAAMVGVSHTCARNDLVKFRAELASSASALAS